MVRMEEQKLRQVSGFARGAPGSSVTEPTFEPSAINHCPVRLPLVLSSLGFSERLLCGQTCVSWCEGKNQA